MEIITKKIADMNFAAYNPRIQLEPGDEEYESIKKSLSRHGLVQPIVWNRRTNTVVGGHQRLKVLADMGVTDVDVSVVDLDPIAEKQLNIALNKVEGKWDDRKLSDLLIELGDDASETGFTFPEIEVLQNELQTFFEDSSGEEEDASDDDVTQDFFIISLPFEAEAEKEVRAYIKKNGEEGIVEAIVRKVRGEP